MLTAYLVASVIAAVPGPEDPDAAARVRVDASTTVAVGLGLSPNARDADVLPIVALHVDVPFDDWFIGGGCAALTYIEPQFPEDDFVPRAQVHVTMRGGVVVVRGSSAELIADAGFMVGIVRNFLTDQPPGSLFFAPSAGATSTLRAIWRFDQLNVQAAAGATIVTAGVLQIAPTIAAGVGWRF